MTIVGSAVVLCCATALAYQIAALAAALAHRRRPESAGSHTPAISVLKPVHGVDPGFAEAIRSHAEQVYGEFELLFGVSDPDDPAIPEIKKLQAAYPALRIELILCTTQTPNPKVAKVIDLAAHARYPVLLVNDSDIRVERDYLQSVVQPLADPEVGLVTCLYRVAARNLPSRFEALGIATDFAPGTLIAPWVGVNEFALGATLLLRREDLVKLGGFEAVANYVADDYQLAKQICALGLRVHMSKVVVETSASEGTWLETWKHQVRWQKTIRVSRGDGYAGLPVTFATLWAGVALVAGAPMLAGSVLLVRLAMAVTVGVSVLGCPITARFWPLIPLRDLFGVAAWVAGYCGNTIHWRGNRLRLRSDGRIGD